MDNQSSDKVYKNDDLTEEDLNLINAGTKSFKIDSLSIDEDDEDNQADIGS